MVELRAQDEQTMHQSFAGDVINSAIYLKRSAANVNTAVITALGQDRLSDRMLGFFHQHNLTTDWVFKHPTKIAGLYLIETDAQGERSFCYWRNDSAARQLANFLNEEVVEQIASSDMVFFSGISIAVIAPAQRQKLWQALAHLKHAGVTLVFDPNYRSRLWPSLEDTRLAYQRAFELADIVLPGVEDMQAVYGHQSSLQVIEFCHQYDCREIVVKNGAASVLTFGDGKTSEYTVTAVTQVVDTTSAGDAFNGVYLGARLNGADIQTAVARASKGAGVVIQHPGAIIPEQAFAQALA